MYDDLPLGKGKWISLIAFLLCWAFDPHSVLHFYGLVSDSAKLCK